MNNELQHAIAVALLVALDYLQLRRLRSLDAERAGPPADPPADAERPPSDASP